MRYIMFVVTTVVAALGAAGSLRASGPPAAGDGTLASSVDAIAARALAVPGAVGVSVAVARGERVVVDRGYGKADLEHGVDATGATPFRIGSVTKQFTAAAILRLAERGKISLDDDFTRYVQFPTRGRVITVRHLLTHTSGIKNYTDVPGFFEHGLTGDLTPAQILDPIRKLPLDFEPGTRWSYSNSGYVLLGMIIENVTGVSYAQHLREDLFVPLGLESTRYDVASQVIAGRARGYSAINGTTINVPFMSMTIPYSAGGLLSSAGDLARWQLALVEGKVLAPESYQQMIAPARLADGTEARYGLGVFMSEIDGHRNFMHEGAVPGFNAILVYFPNERLTIAVLSNSPAISAGGLAVQIARAAFAGRDASGAGSP